MKNLSIAFINGSPRLGRRSVSGLLIDMLKTRFDPGVALTQYRINGPEPLDLSSCEKIFEKWAGTKVLIIASPLIVDSLPSRLVETLAAFEQYYVPIGDGTTWVYGLMNNGLYEGIQNKTALAILHYWCEECGLVWGGGLAQGGGGLLRNWVHQKKESPGILKELNAALEAFARRIATPAYGDNVYLNPPMSYKEWKRQNRFWKK
jgi:hypothetical protein